MGYQIKVCLGFSCLIFICTCLVLIHLYLSCIYWFCLVFIDFKIYWNEGFLSRTLPSHRTAREGTGPSFIPLYHFHPLTNIQTFICNFVCEMTITYFQLQRFYLPDCYSMRFTTLSNYYLIDWWCNVDFRLFTCWFDFRFSYSYLT